MSYILDALRRLEQDKASARKSLDPMRSFGEPLQHENNGDEKRRFLQWGLGAFVLILAAVTLTYWFVHRTGPLPKTVRTEKIPTPPAASDSEPRPVVAFSSVSEKSPYDPGVSNAKPAEAAPQVLSRSPVTVHRPPPPVDSGGEMRRDSILLGREAETRGGLFPEDRNNPLLDEERETPPEDAAKVSIVKSRNTGREPSTFRKEERLKVSAIVWSPEKDRRFAVVNLKTVHEGDLIGDVEVVEILEEGIVFNEHGEEFEVMLGKH